MDDLERTRQEFTRQAAGFAASAATTDRAVTQRLLDALDAGGKTGARKTGARKTGARKTGARKTGARKTGARRTGARRTGARRTGARRTGARRTGARRTGAHDTGAREIRALDVACGPGIMTAELAGIAREVVAFDVTPEMLIRARERCTQAGLRNVLFGEGSASDMPFPDNCFDVVMTRLSIHHFREPCRVLDEMRRVSKRGGTVVIADIVSSEFPEKSALQNAIEVLRDPSHVRMYPASELASLVAGAGLRIEKEETWDTAREFEEWAGIVALPERIDPLRIIAAALARAGEDAGIGLSLAGGTIAFLHRWRMIVARKP